MKAYRARNYLTALDSVKHVLKSSVEIIADKMPCYKQIRKRAGIKWKHATPG